MDHITNPFSPGAGTPPPELVGRESILAQTHVLFERVKIKRSEKSLIMIGLRGVGKTVLLNEARRKSEASGYKSVYIEAHEDKRLPALLAPELRKLLFSLDLIVNAGDKVKRGLAILRGFVGALRFSIGGIDNIGLDIESLKGVGDSGDIEADLSELFVAVGEAAEERGTAVSIFIDELQYLTKPELSALIMAMHRIQQLQLPLVLVAAGLPILPELAGDSKSYSERLFSFPEIGPLPKDEATVALVAPVAKFDVTFTDLALDEIYKTTCGYPYFLQEWGYQSWNSSDSKIIDIDVVLKVKDLATARLDQNFFRVRFDRLTPGEKRFLRSMAELGKGPYRTGEIATSHNIMPKSIGPVRATLIKKGMIYSPSHGELDFTVPMFDEFMRRVMRFEPNGTTIPHNAPLPKRLPESLGGPDLFSEGN